MSCEIHKGKDCFCEKDRLRGEEFNRLNGHSENKQLDLPILGGRNTRNTRGSNIVK